MVGPDPGRLGGAAEIPYLNGAEGGTRTHTTLSGQRILSPLCLPFHHSGLVEAKGTWPISV